MRISLNGKEYEMGLDMGDPTGDRSVKIIPCPRCGKGFDNNGDGDCAVCFRLSAEQAAELKGTK